MKKFLGLTSLLIILYISIFITILKFTEKKTIYPYKYSFLIDCKIRLFANEILFKNLFTQAIYPLEDPDCDDNPYIKQKWSLLFDSIIQKNKFDLFLQEKFFFELKKIIEIEIHKCDNYIELYQKKIKIYKENKQKVLELDTISKLNKQVNLRTSYINIILLINNYNYFNLFKVTDQNKIKFIKNFNIKLSFYIFFYVLVLIFFLISVLKNLSNLKKA